MKVKVSEATKEQLNWMVALCQGLVEPFSKQIEADHWDPTTDWAQGGPILDKEDIIFSYAPGHDVPDHENFGLYYATKIHNGMGAAKGPTRLIAAMRCLVVATLGREVEVPEELK